MKKQFVYLLVTTDKYEFAMSCCDTLRQMSIETGIEFTKLWHSYYRNETCCGGRYKVLKVDITYPSEFTFEDYIDFCTLHKIKPCHSQNMGKYLRCLSIFK